MAAKSCVMAEAEHTGSFLAVYIDENIPRLVRIEDLQLNSVEEDEYLEKIKGFATQVFNDRPTPSKLAMEKVCQVYNILKEYDLDFGYATVYPMSEGGITFGFNVNESNYLIDIYNDGEIALVTIPAGSQPYAIDIESVKHLQEILEPVFDAENLFGDGDTISTTP